MIKNRYFFILRRMLRRIKIFFCWWPVIWRDEQWDEFYLFEILRFKFKLMEKFFESNDSLSPDSKQRAKEIKICRILCERLIKHDYTTPWDKLEDTVFLWLQKFERREYYMPQQDINYLCKMIQKHVQKWWD